MKILISILITFVTHFASSQSITDTLRLDIDGDGIMERVFFKGNDCRKLVIAGGDLEVIQVGCGSKIAHIGDFNWVDNWKIVKKKVTWQTTFLENGDVDDTEEVTMENDGIYVGTTDPSGGGIITYMNGKLIWIHQGD